jgi:type IV pilus assembly protein PilB
MALTTSSTTYFNDEYVLEILQENGYLDPEQVEAARTGPKGAHRALEQLIEDEVIAEEDIARAMAGFSGYEFYQLDDFEVQKEALNLMSKEDVKRFQVLPIRIENGALVVATYDPLNIELLDSLSYRVSVPTELIVMTRKDVKEGIVQHYGGLEELNEAMAGMDGIMIGDMMIGGGEMQEGDSGDAPIIRLVSTLLLDAYRMRASDIHLEPLEKRFRVRFRIDGKLAEMEDPPKKLQAAMISRLKIMTGSMSIDEKRLPQDGRIQVKVQGKSIDLRVSVIPTNHGESIVMRILDKSSLSLGLPQLGFLSDDQEIVERLITLPDGIFLVTGPTGSGKTTTLYSCLAFINKPDRKIITVEDPVEYQLNGINQVQVNTDIGMSFPAALRSMLRQAPNIIMIGEIRDADTATIAINASLTGHLVFSTLHTNNATAAIARLVDMGIQPFLVASSIRAVQAQRLVRAVCLKCKQPHLLSDAELDGLGLDPNALMEANAAMGAGCDVCKGTGYKGRKGLFEIFQVDDEARHMINDRVSSSVLRARARQLGMRTMREDGIRKVLSGMTTAEEVIGVTMADKD